MVRFYSTSSVTLNEWNHLSILINDTKNLLYLIINNKVVNTIDLSQNGGFTPTFQDIVIGKNSTEFFYGDIDQIELFDTNFTPNNVKQLYHKSIDNNLVFKHDFENVDFVNNIVYDEAGSSHGSVVNASANPSEDIVGVLNQYVKNGHAFESSVDQHIEIPTTNEHSIQGHMMNNVTFMGWVKPDENTTNCPVVNKHGVFSFAINNGLPELLLGNGSTYHPLPVYSIMNMHSYSTVQYIKHGSLLTFEHLNDLNERDSEHEIGSGIAITTVQPEVVEGVYDGSIGLKVNSSSYLQIEGQNRVNLNLNTLTFGAWIKFDDASAENQPIFSIGGASDLNFVLDNGDLILRSS